MVDIAFLPPSSESATSIACFNVVNPQTTRWGEVVLAVQEFYASQGRIIEAVSLGEWLKQLAGVDVWVDGGVLVRYPALRLLDFFQSLRDDHASMRCAFSASRALECSPGMAQLCPIDDKLIRKWLVGWAF